MPKNKRKPYTISDKRILEDLKKSTLTFGMQLEMARKYNQGDTSFAKLVADKDISRSRAEQIVKRILNMDIKLLERITKIAQEHNCY